MFKIFNSIKSNIKNVSLNIINIVLTLTTLIYMISVHGFDHINKELIINFLIGSGIILFIFTIMTLFIILTLTIGFKITLSKITNNMDAIIEQVQSTLNNKGKAQDDM